MAESDRAAMAAAQARADEVYVVWSAQAPHFLIGEFSAGLSHSVGPRHAVA